MSCNDLAHISLRDKYITSRCTREKVAAIDSRQEANKVPHRFIANTTPPLIVLHKKRRTLQVAWKTRTDFVSVILAQQLIRTTTRSLLLHLPQPLLRKLLFLNPWVIVVALSWHTLAGVLFLNLDKRFPTTRTRFCLPWVPPFSIRLFSTKRVRLKRLWRDLREFGAHVFFFFDNYSQEELAPSLATCQRLSLLVSWRLRHGMLPPSTM